MYPNPALDSLTAQVTQLRDAAHEIVSAEGFTGAVARFTDAELEAFVEAAAALAKSAELMRTVGIGAVGARSTRDAGHSGFAQARGHRNTVSFVQQITGSSRGEAARLVRVGESLVETTSDAAGGSPAAPPADSASGDLLDIFDTDSPAPGSQPLAPPALPWHAGLAGHLTSGKLSTAQHDAIRRGLGEPPANSGSEAAELSQPVETTLPSAATHPSAAALPSPAAVEAWRLAAEQLALEAPDVTVEDLAKHARAVRDILDPEGANARYLARYEQRSFRMWTDREGLTHGSFVFDDESAAWIRGVIDTALRPRRGGPRFVDPSEQAAAKTLADDPRTNEQLAHDLLIDVLKSGTVADAATVLGARQAGVRLVQLVDRDEYLAEITQKVERNRKSARSVTRFEDDAVTLPDASAAQQRCNSGVVPVIADRLGNPLDVGREHRLYTAKQRVALALRDGGCRWPGCDRPPSYCEAHHIDEWVADSGRTDIDRGVLLCRFHHMQLHHGGWRITRDGTEEFLLHPPGRHTPSSAPPGGHARTEAHSPPDSDPQTAPPEACTVSRAITLRAPVPLSFAWHHLTPPRTRFRDAA